MGEKPQVHTHKSFSNPYRTQKPSGLCLLPLSLGYHVAPCWVFWNLKGSKIWERLNAVHRGLCIGNTVKYTLMNHCLIPIPPGSHFAPAFSHCRQVFWLRREGAYQCCPGASLALIRWSKFQVIKWPTNAFLKPSQLTLLDHTVALYWRIKITSCAANCHSFSSGARDLVISLAYFLFFCPHYIRLLALRWRRQ